MSVEKPTNESELFNFYYTVVKPIYTAAQTDNRLPVEILFEIHAALDHLSRRYRPTSPESEAQCVDRAFGHFKRGCLDVFKLRLKKCTDQYDALNSVDLSVVDNGAFYGEMIRFHGEIAAEAEEARNNEGEFDRGFDNWLPVFKKCIQFEKDYFLNPKVEWARKREDDAKKVAEQLEAARREQERKRDLRSRIIDGGIGLVLGVVGSLIASYIWNRATQAPDQPQRQGRGTSAHIAPASNTPTVQPAPTTRGASNPQPLSRSTPPPTAPQEPQAH